MSNIINEYTPYWKDLGSVLVYQTSNFQFHNTVLITEFEGCLINRISQAQIYHAIHASDTTVKNTDFIKQIRKDAQDLSIVIISNQINSSKLNIDMIKRKLENFLQLHKIPMLAFFALKANRMSKPHTGMWKLLNMYYVTKGSCHITKAFIVSDFGGRIIEETKKNGTTKVQFDKSDIDRAFANNIKIPFFTILEYLTPEKKEKFTWNNKTISPELRQVYINTISQGRNPNIFAKLAETGLADRYMILIYGAPCSGKTTLAEELIKKWRNSEWGKTHEIKRFGLDNYSRGRRVGSVEKAIVDRISVIVDGECHTAAQRAVFEEIAKKHKTSVINIEVNPGLGFSYIFNHVSVELSQDENKVLYSDKDYHYYKSMLSKPSNYIFYCPVIKQTEQVMQFRY